MNRAFGTSARIVALALTSVIVVGNPAGGRADDTDLKTLQQNRIDEQDATKTEDAAKQDKDTALWSALLKDVIRAKQMLESEGLRFQSVETAFAMYQMAVTSSGVESPWLESVGASDDIGVVHSMGEMVIVSPSGLDPADYISSGGTLTWDGVSKGCSYHIWIGNARKDVSCDDFASESGYEVVAKMLHAAIKMRLSQVK